MDMTRNSDKVRSVRVTAAPNTAPFDGGMRYLQRSMWGVNSGLCIEAQTPRLASNPSVRGALSYP